jgi:hypothetical protein
MITQPENKELSEKFSDWVKSIDQERDIMADDLETCINKIELHEQSENSLKRQEQRQQQSQRGSQSNTKKLPETNQSKQQQQSRTNQQPQNVKQQTDRQDNENMRLYNTSNNLQGGTAFPHLIKRQNPVS